MIFLLLVLFQIKHLLADYFLQGKYMLGKFKPHPDYILPLAAHCAVHGVMTFAIASIVSSKAAFWVALLDFVLHFAMDRVKASPELLGRFEALTKETYPTATDEQKRSNTRFWWSLGLDQTVHHLTHYLIIWILL